MRTLPAIALLLLASAVIAAPALAGPGSGVHGSVKAGPTCPVEPFPPDDRCAPRAVATTIRIRSEDTGKTVKKVKSSKRGHFKAHLRPGRYSLEPRPTDSAMYCAPETVEVEAHRSTKARLFCDTGLR
jgi:hypothetical protein